MTLPLERLGVDLDISQLVTEPNGVLTGDFKFTAKPLSTRVVIKSFSPSQSCDFYVTVEDREPPKVIYCPPKDVSISINSYIGPVTWKEPVFGDNVGVTKKLQNMVNGKPLGEQVYYVNYEAFDAFNNVAVCPFFVHVKGIKNIRTTNLCFSCTFDAFSFIQHQFVRQNNFFLKSFKKSKGCVRRYYFIVGNLKL